MEGRSYMYMSKRGEAKTDLCGTPFFRRRSVLGLLSPVVRVKLLFPTKFRDHLDHVLVRQKSQQLAGEATVPDSVISNCQIYKHGTRLLFCLKRTLNVLRKQNDLIHARLFVSKSSCSFGSKGSTISSTRL